MERDEQNQAKPDANTDSQQLEPAKKPKYLLVVCNKAKNLEIKYALEEGREFIIGAEPQSSIPVDDDYVSARHFSIRAEGDRAEVKDLGSKNGLYLMLKEDAQIIPGQTLLAGKTTFRLEEQKDGENQPLP